MLFKSILFKLTGILRRTVVNKAPRNPSQVLFGDNVVNLALIIFLPNATPQKYAAISLIITIQAGNTTLNITIIRL